MYLSRVEIARDNRRKIQDLTHVGAYHGWVEQSFPHEFENGQRSRKLWRIDTLGNKHYLLLVSEQAPDLEALEKYGVTGSAETKNYQPFLDSLSQGDRLKFKVQLNPVIRKSAGTGKAGPIVPLVSDEDQMDFLLDRSEKRGFRVEECLIIEKGYERLKKPKRRDVQLVKAVYQGELIVTDVEQFKETLVVGFGRQKAYGFGLMTVIA